MFGLLKEIMENSIVIRKITGEKIEDLREIKTTYIVIRKICKEKVSLREILKTYIGWQEDYINNLFERG